MVGDTSTKFSGAYRCGSVFFAGECGDPATQTCSHHGAAGRGRAPTTRAWLFAEYSEDFTDSAGQSHALCSGGGKCCDGGLWGDTVPVDEDSGAIYVDMGQGECRGAAGEVPTRYAETGTRGDDSWCRVSVRPLSNAACPLSFLMPPSLPSQFPPPAPRLVCGVWSLAPRQNGTAVH